MDQHIYSFIMSGLIGLMIPGVIAGYILNWHGRIRSFIWWKFMTGATITVPWPVGTTRIRQETSHLWDYISKNDPNNTYRPRLEEHVGTKGWDWEYQGVRYGYPSDGHHVVIKFRRGKESWASYFSLLWG